MRKLHLISIVTFMAVALFPFLTGCGGGDGSSNQFGTLGVSLTDAPSGSFAAVNVTVSKVRVHQSASASENDAGWTDLTLSPVRKINLLNLANGVLEDLGEVPLAAGHYTQLRLVLVANSGANLTNSVVLQGTTAEIALDTPSAVQSGIKLINEFDVVAGRRVDLVLDFDASKSVVTRGNGAYLLKPVVKVVPTALNGIDGFIAAPLLGSNVSISAQVNGTVVGFTAPNAQTGEFFLARLAPGNYDVVIAADNHATAIIAGVPVTSATSVTTVSTNAAPLTLPASQSRTISGIVTLNPPSSTEPAALAAKQALGALTVIVRSQTADFLTGAYSLTLPIDAPLLGQYGTGVLPIVFIAQPGAAGKYTATCSATGYQTQSVPVDITLANALQNFTLVP